MFTSDVTTCLLRCWKKKLMLLPGSIHLPCLQECTATSMCATLILSGVGEQWLVANLEVVFPGGTAAERGGH